MDSSTEPAQPTPIESSRLLEQGQRLTFSHRGRTLELCVVPGKYLALLYNGVVRKERVFAGREPLYVWTNVELEWEEHHYIEVRYWLTSGVIVATVNGTELAGLAVEPSQTPSLSGSRAPQQAGDLPQGAI